PSGTLITAGIRVISWARLIGDADRSPAMSKGTELALSSSVAGSSSTLLVFPPRPGLQPLGGRGGLLHRRRPGRGALRPFLGRRRSLPGQLLRLVGGRGDLLEAGLDLGEHRRDLLGRLAYLLVAGPDLLHVALDLLQAVGGGLGRLHLGERLPAGL